MCSLPKLVQLTGMLRGNSQDAPNVAALGVLRLNRILAVRLHCLSASDQRDDDLDPIILAVYMRGRVVVRVANEPNAVKRLCAHTFNLSPTARSLQPQLREARSELYG